MLRFLSAHLREVANSKSKHKMGRTSALVLLRLLVGQATDSTLMVQSHNCASLSLRTLCEPVRCRFAGGRPACVRACAHNVMRAPAPDAPPLQVASDIGVAIHVFTVLIEHADTLAGVARVPAAVVAPDDVAVGVGGDAPDVRSSRRAIPSLRSQASESGQANFSEELARAIRDNDAAVAAGSSNRSLGVGDSAAADGSAPSTVREEQGTGPDGEDQAAAAAAKAEEEAAAAAAKKAEEDAAAAAKQAEEEAAAAAAKKAEEEAAAAAAKKAEEEAAAAAAKQAEEEAAAAAAKKAEEEAAAAAAKQAEEEAAAAAKQAEEEAAATSGGTAAATAGGDSAAAASQNTSSDANNNNNNANASNAAESGAGGKKKRKRKKKKKK